MNAIGKGLEMTEQEFAEYVRRVSPDIADRLIANDKANRRTYKNAPHFVSNYSNDTVAIVVGGKVVAGGVK